MLDLERKTLEERPWWPPKLVPLEIVARVLEVEPLDTPHLDLGEVTPFEVTPGFEPGNWSTHG